MLDLVLGPAGKACCCFRDVRVCRSAEGAASDHHLVTTLLTLPSKDGRTRSTRTRTRRLWTLGTVADLIRLNPAAYQRELQNNLGEEKNKSYEEIVRAIGEAADKIRSKVSTKPTKQWYEASRETLEPLITARKEAWKLYLRNQTVESKREYKRAKQEVRHQLRAAKTTHFESLLVDYQAHVKTHQHSRAAKCLRMALELHGKKFRNVRGEKRIVNDTALQNFYMEQFGLQKGLEDAQSKGNNAPLEEIIRGHNTTEPNFTRDELKEQLAKLSLHKAPGPNGIRPELIVYGGEQLHTHLLELFNNCWTGRSQLPRAWVDANVVPIYKGKGSRSEPSSYRPIFLLDVIGKLYASMVVARLNKTVELPETQYGFRKGYSTEQAILAIRTVIRKSLDQRRPVDLVFVDITKAFDSVPHQALFNLLQHVGASTNIQHTMQQLHDKPKGTIQGTTKHFTCKRGVRQGSIEGPILFNLFLQKILEEVFQHGNTNGVPFITAEQMQWTLQHLEYADDLCLIADSPEAAQEVLMRLVAVLRQYDMKIAPAKTVWMHVGGGGDVPDQLTFEDEQVKRVQRVTYLGSVLDGDGDATSAVNANCQRAKYQILRIRPLLRSSAVRKRRKAACIETFVKPSLLYGLATIVLRVVDDRKLSAVINTGKRMALGCWSRREKTILELNNAIPTSNIALQLLLRRLNLWTSVNGSSGITSRLCQSDLRPTTGKSRPVPQRNWMHQLQIDAKEVFGSNVAAAEWIKDPSYKYPKTDLTNVKPKLVGRRERNVKCSNSECHRMFATRSEMNRHMRTAHNTSTNNTIEEESKPYLCPITSCNMCYRRKGWLTRHIVQCHQASEEALSPTKISDTQTNGHNNASSVPTPVLATATSEFKCPLCIKILPTNKGIVNHCYKKHRYSVVKGKYINEITAGTAARSSDSGRDTPAVSLSV